MSGAGNPPAGWYPDPTEAGSERWWDGSNWGQQTRMPPTVTPIVSPPASPSAPAPAPAPAPALATATANPLIPTPGPAAGPKSKSGLSSGAMLAIVAVLGLIGLLIGGAALMMLTGDDDELVEATKTTAAGSDASTGSETTSPSGDGDATSETTSAPDSDGGSDDGTSGLTGDGSDDVVSCTRVDEDTIILEMVNNGDETASYWLTVGFFDDAGTRLADESSFVNYLRSGERSIEEHFVFEEAGTVCEVLDVDRFPGVSSAEELAEVGECVIAAEPDSFDDFAASLSITNSTATTSDYSVEVAFVDPNGIRRGTGSVYIEAVRTDETAPGEIFSSTDFVEGYSCQIVGVTRTDS